MDITSDIIRGVTLKIPIIASNMSTVTNSTFCIQLSKLGALGVLHRASSKEEILKEINIVKKECNLVAASIRNRKRSV